MNRTQKTARPAGPGVITEYGIRFTVVGGSLHDQQLKRRTHVKVCGRSPADAAMELERVRAWQEGNPLCPQIDAVIVTRTVTVARWAVPADTSGCDA